MWKTVAEGKSIDELVATVGNFELKKGTKIRFEMDLNMPVAFVFDLAGVEHLFSIDGVDIKDVYGEGLWKAVIEAEADPAWLVAILAFIRAHWIAIVIGGIILYTLISAVRMLVFIAEIITVEWLKWGIIGGGLILGYLILSRRSDKGIGKEKTNDRDQ
ncbi:hypothetical protein ES703_27612 [subsurface metagenome]